MFFVFSYRVAQSGAEGKLSIDGHTNGPILIPRRCQAVNVFLINAVLASSLRFLGECIRQH